MDLFRRKAGRRRHERRYFYLGDGLALTELRHGGFIYVDPAEESVCPHLIVSGGWEPGVQSVLLSIVGPGDHVVEVGAHVGFHTLALAKRVGATGSVTSFEANPRLAGLAQKTLRLNGCAKWATVTQKAVSIEAGSLKFSLSRRWGGAGHLWVGDDALGPETETIDVDAIRIDDLTLPRLKLIRIDAEGSEALILRSAARTILQPDIIICMEWDTLQMGSRADPNEFADWLSGLGFNFWKIEPDGSLTKLDLAALKAAAACDLIASRHSLGLHKGRAVVDFTSSRTA